MPKHVIVIAESKTQFDDYVQEAVKTEIPVINGAAETTVRETIFLWVRSRYRLMGITFSKDSKIVYVGSWYNLPQDELRAIECYFESRKVDK